MRYILFILLFGMMLKDTGYFPYPNGLRISLQVLAGLAGLIWLLKNTKKLKLLSYWPMTGYALVSVISALFSPGLEFALLQAFSVVAVFAFCISFAEYSRESRKSEFYFGSLVLFGYGTICLIGVLLHQVQPSLVYGRVGDWFYLSEGWRFHGLLPNPGMQAAVAGLVIGASLLMKKPWWIKAPFLLAAIACLVLAQSRTFWVATLIALFATAWFIRLIARRRLMYIAGASILSVMLLVNGSVLFSKQELESEIRLGSIKNLSGRNILWYDASAKIFDRPVIGYGPTLGALALRDTRMESAQISRDTLHNGYLQAILDLGFVGFFFYISIFVVASYRIVRSYAPRSKAYMLFGIFFMMFANLGESIIYSASVSHAVVFWFIVAYSLRQDTVNR
jgi:exopolysaccharide production protein ExoQ